MSEVELPPEEQDDARTDAVRPPWAVFKRALEEASFRPSRRLGQNFLLDDGAARAIARDAGVSAGDRVVEIGPGCGFLSVHLAHAGAELYAVEVDERLAEVAARFLAPYTEARVVVGDALAGKHALGPELRAGIPAEGAWHVVSNLPYSISGAVLALLAAEPNPPASMTVLVQREVAARLAATPGTPDWGPLTVAVQVAYVVRAGRVLGPGSFWPRPKIDSQVAHLELRSDRAPLEQRALVVRVAQRLLRHRRQSLGRVLRDLLGEAALAGEVLADGGWPPDLRAERLDLGALAHLAAGPVGAAVESGGA